MQLKEIEKNASQSLDLDSRDSLEIERALHFLLHKLFVGTQMYRKKEKTKH